MINEGVILSTDGKRIKSEMVRQSLRLERTTPQQLEGAVFQALTGQPRDEIDWSFEDNQAGYFTWVKAFDYLLVELIDDGYLDVESLPGGGKVLVARETDPSLPIPQAPDEAV
jgi:hypothetical protein